MLNAKRQKHNSHPNEQLPLDRRCLNYILEQSAFLVALATYERTYFIQIVANYSRNVSVKENLEYTCPKSCYISNVERSGLTALEEKSLGNIDGVTDELWKDDGYLNIQ